MTKTPAKSGTKLSTPSAAKTATRPSGKASAKVASSAPPDPVAAAPKPAARKAVVATELPVSAKKASAPAKTRTTPTQASAPRAESAVPAPKVSPNMPTTATKVDSKLANAWKNKAGRDLSDEELMAMPDSEYMNEKQQDFFRARLEALKDDLLSNAGETTEHLREDTSIVPDPADRATIEEEHALELRTRDRERKLLKKISQALQRIESGDYGYCDETGEPIGLGRLIARPTATLSLEAQQRRELKQKMFGD